MLKREVRAVTAVRAAASGALVEGPRVACCRACWDFHTSNAPGTKRLRRRGRTLAGWPGPAQDKGRALYTRASALGRPAAPALVTRALQAVPTVCEDPAEVRWPARRAGLAQPRVEVRWEDLSVEARVLVGQRARPTVLSFYRDALLVRPPPGCAALAPQRVPGHQKLATCTPVASSRALNKSDKSRAWRRRSRR